MAAAVRSFAADPENVEDEVNDHAEGAAEVDGQRVSINISSHNHIESNEGRPQCM